MTYHVTDLGRTLDRFRSDWAAATSPAATPATTHLEQGRRGPDHELGRMAQAYEDMHEPDFHREITGLFFIGLCAVCFLAAAGFAIAAPYILRLLFALFDLLAVL